MRKQAQVLRRESESAERSRCRPYSGPANSTDNDARRPGHDRIEGDIVPVNGYTPKSRSRFCSSSRWTGFVRNALHPACSALCLSSAKA